MKIFLMLFIFISVYAQNIELNLKQFAELVSSQHRVNIIIDDKIQKDSFSFYVQKNNNTILLAVFKKMLSLKKLDLIYDKKNNFYYIQGTKLLLPIKNKLYTIKLKALVFDDIKLILNQLKNVTYSYISNTNTILLFCTPNQYKNVIKVIIENDVVPKQFQLKITVVQTNLNDSKEKGIEISAYTQSLVGNTQYFVNLITMPYTASTNVFTGSMSGYTAALHFLDSIGVSSISSSPLMTVQSGKKIFFSAVENIPYLNSSSTVNGASQSATQNITYRDIGLKIELSPKLINDIVFIDLNFVIETILDSTSLTPTTAKRELKNSFQLKKGELLVLSGLIQDDKSVSTVGIPFLMKMPYIGQVFRYDRDISKKSSLSIMIEII